MITSALKITAERMAEEAECRPMMFSAPSPG